jgi:hypothetical protein
MNGPWHRRKSSHTTHLRDISSSVRILRERHPFEGHALPVMGTVKRRGVLLLLAVLPDGSRSLIPASWTDWKAVEVTDERSSCGTEHRKACLAPLTDLLHARAIVDALLGRGSIPQSEPAADEESCHATDPGRSRTSPSRTTTTEPLTRRQSTRRGSRHSGTHHCASLRGSQTNGGNQ